MSKREPPKLVSVRLDSVDPVPIQWLWYGYFPLGSLSFIDGDPDTGKTSMLLDIAARITSGRPMPDGSQSIPPSAIMILTSEDDVANTIVPRLMAADADRELCHAIDLKESDWPVFPGCLDELRRELVENKIRLLIIDPIMSFLGSADTGRDSSTRTAIGPLAGLAMETGCTVLGIRHNRKSGSSAIYRGGGSVAFTALARAVWQVARDKEDPELRYLARVKLNLLTEDESPTQTFRFDSVPWPADLPYNMDQPPTIGRIRWLGTSDKTADDLTMRGDSNDKDGGSSAIDEAVHFLQQELASGPMPVKDAQKAARDAGISGPTLKRAKAKLGVKSEKTFSGHWVWQLGE
jgi:hypothetical protein